MLDAFTLAALLLTACGGETARAPASGLAEGVRGIATILTSGPTVADLTPRSATIPPRPRATSSVPSFMGRRSPNGLLATDRDMAGTGHAGHHPLLVGLEPDTVYHFSFGGVDRDGNVYRGAERMIRTPAAEATASRPNGVDLARPDNGARLVERSSNFDGVADDAPWGALSAIDGDPTTEWATAGDGDDAWTEIELPTETHVTGVSFWTRTMVDTARIAGFRIVTDRGEVVGPFELADAAQPYDFATEFTARRLRFEATATMGGNTGAVEIEVYGTPNP